MAKTVDELAIIAETESVTTTASCTGVNIEGMIGEDQFIAVVDTGATTGTVDGSNYYSLQLEASDAIGGTYVAIGNPVLAEAAATRKEVGFTANQLEDAVPGANHFRVTATKVGTTATAVAYTAQISKV